MAANKYFILTGAPGSGKSTILNILNQNGYSTVEEPARKVIAEQRRMGGKGTWEQDTRFFIQLMLKQALYNYKEHCATESPVFFDRGIPDLIGYAKLAGLKMPELNASAQEHRYNNTVVMAPSWKQIYVNDDERQATFEQAAKFGDHLRQAYLSLGYNVVCLPLDTPQNRVKFILDICDLRH